MELSQPVRTPGIRGRSFRKVNKVSKVQIKTELITPRQVASGRIKPIEIEGVFSSAPVGISGTTERQHVTEAQIRNTREIFGANARQAHLFDLLNGICTFLPKRIKNAESDSRYYEVTILQDELYDFALGPFANDTTYRRYVQNEIKNQRTGTDMAIYYQRDGTEYFTIFKPIIVSAVEYRKPTSKQNAIGGKITAEVTILFFKPLFKTIVEGGQASAFLYVPFALTAALRATVDKYAEIIRQKYRTNARSSIASIRRLLLFLLSFDYKRGAIIEFDPLEMAYYCNDALLRQYIETGKFRRKDAYIFTNMALDIFQIMQEEGYLDGLKIRRGDFFTVLRDGRFRIKLIESINAPWKAESKRLPF